MPDFKNKNTLQQDLFLACKGQYDDYRLTRLEVLKIVCAAHILSPKQNFPTESVIHWLLEEFVYKGVILLNPRQFGKFLMDQSMRMFRRDMSYYERIASMLIEELGGMQVREQDGDTMRLLIPFEPGEIDDGMLSIIKQEATRYVPPMERNPASEISLHAR